ncbi:hypothetical protein LXM25_18600 [Dyadobacter sp. LJ53]|uniref:hypothetical protein n=1 Tax=Dyadobacter chenwenxiniae TaxID=2906456 RepID=UPI001F249DB8|nr:hypothetical protein [Dyadobacter chenwenxiniae]MCF0052085.1 hypothetical protein [Dyadobacter chenwenxiniae]
MVLHERERYPLLKFLFDEFSGRFFENELTWLNRMVILYHNRRTLSIHDDEEHFLQEFVSKNKGSSFYDYLLGQTARKKVQMTRLRASYLLINNPEMIHNLLIRDDYGMPRARYETILQIHNWLEQTPYDLDPDTGLDLNAWKRDIQNRFAHKFKALGLTPSKGALLGCIEDVGQFSDMFKGVDQQEREGKFQKLIGCLTEADWIAPAGEPEKFQFRKAAHGGRLWIAALYYALYQKQHIKDSHTASAIAGLFNTWLVHPFSKESFEKVFQPEEQSKFAGRGNHQRSRYAQECFLLIQNL